MIPHPASRRRTVGLLVALLLLTACAAPVHKPATLPPPREAPASATPATGSLPSQRAQEVVLFALSLLETGYRFGGKNPSAGLDCSGMVAYVFQRAAGLNLSGSAADIARQGRSVDREQLRPGDLVFFNTRNQPYSHVGIYLGDDRFVHAPNSQGKVRIDLLNAPYYALRFESGRTYFD